MTFGIATLYVGTKLNRATVVDDVFRDALSGGLGTDCLWARLAPGATNALLDRSAGEQVS